MRVVQKSGISYQILRHKKSEIKSLIFQGQRLENHQ
jgi:hypothetical protein